jgi:16S rRNA (cytosine967-C5)-methyltransferase
VVRTRTAAFGAMRDCVAAGLASVQDESGSLVAPLMEPERGSRLLDLAAAPGGKACHLAELLGGTGMVLAYDRSAAKLERLRDNARRLGLANVAVAQADCRELEVEPAVGVLLDAPCSGLGVLGRRPDLRWRKQAADLPRLAALQSELLAAAARLVTPGGMLVYSVCSFEPEETAQVAAAFATAHPEFAPADVGLPRALRAAPGILYFLPQAHGMDGGFVARWRQRESGAS